MGTTGREVSHPTVKAGDNDKIMVVGFLFSSNFKQVVLIRKTHPAWQAGKLNGLGGHVEKGETPLTAMVREFKEESGLEVPAEKWREYARMEGEDPEGDKWVLHVFCATETQAQCQMAYSTTQESVACRDLNVVFNSADSLSSLSWLVPLAIDSLQSPFPCKVRARIRGGL